MQKLVKCRFNDSKCLATLVFQIPLKTKRLIKFHRCVLGSWARQLKTNAFSFVTKVGPIKQMACWTFHKALQLVMAQLPFFPFLILELLWFTTSWTAWNLLVMCKWLKSSLNPSSRLQLIFSWRENTHISHIDNEKRPSKTVFLLITKQIFTLELGYLQKL